MAELLPDLDSEAIDFGAASQCFAEHRPLRRKDLETLGLVRKVQGRTVPTTGGILLFGRERLARFPDAHLQAGRFAGTVRANLADRAEVTAYPVLAIEQAVGFVERNTRLGMTVGRVRRRDQPAVPPAALREVLVNAFVHADYAQRGAPIRVAVFDDRIEVENPGILLPGLTVDDLRDGVSRVRNRVVARVFKELGLVEQWGTGVQRMISACEAAGLPAPEFAQWGTGIVTLTISTETMVLRPVPICVDRSFVRVAGSPHTAQQSARGHRHRPGSMPGNGASKVGVAATNPAVTRARCPPSLKLKARQRVHRVTRFGATTLGTKTRSSSSHTGHAAR